MPVKQGTRFAWSKARREAHAKAMRELGARRRGKKKRAKRGNGHDIRANGVTSQAKGVQLVRSCGESLIALATAIEAMPADEAGSLLRDFSFRLELQPTKREGA